MKPSLKDNLTKQRLIEGYKCSCGRTYTAYQINEHIMEHYGIHTSSSTKWAL